MREIRYRAWDKTSNLMRTDITSIEFKSDGSLAQINVTSGVDILYPEEEAILMQYTGLKDKNGVEIYEGDVVREYDEEWKPEPYIFEADMHSFCGNTGLEPDLDCCEVIGNIYEHGHLLENESKE